MQIYTSKSYSARRGNLVMPKEQAASSVPSDDMASSDDAKYDVDKHVLSPQLVDAISQSTQVVWANCDSHNGLLGRSDVKLHTAVGLPVAVDALGNMCVVVMYSPKNINSNDEAIDYLQTIFNFATSNMGGILPLLKSSSSSSSSSSSPSSSPPPHSEGEGGVDGATLPLPSTARSKNFQLPTGWTQAPESVPVDDNSSTSASTSDTSKSTSTPASPQFDPVDDSVLVKAQHKFNKEQPNFVTHFISLRRDTRRTVSTPDLGVLAGRGKEERGERGSPGKRYGGAEAVHVTHVHSLTAAPKDLLGIPMLPSHSEIKLSSLDGSQSPESDISDEFRYNIWSNVLDQETGMSSDSTPRLNADLEAQYLSTDLTANRQYHSGVGGGSAAQDKWYTLNDSTNERVSEFVEGFLGLSVFDAADVWYASSDNRLTQISTYVSKDAPSEFSAFNEKTAASISMWDGVVGESFATANPVWRSYSPDLNPNTNKIFDSERFSLLQVINVNTILAVPVVSDTTNANSFVICFYSRDVIEPFPMALRFVQQAIKLVWNDVKPDKDLKNFHSLGEMAGNFDIQHNFSRKVSKHNAHTMNRPISNPYFMVACESQSRCQISHSSVHSPSLPPIQSVPTTP